MKNFLLNILQVFRILDENRQISITNIAVIIVLVKLWQTPSTNMTDVGSLFIALSHYGYKKYLNKDTINQAAAVANQISDKVDALNS